MHEIVLSSDGTGQLTSSNIIRTTNKGKTRGEKILEHPKPYRQRSITTHKRWQKLGDRLELVIKQQKKGVERHSVLGKLLILMFVIMYVKNKFQSVIVIAIFRSNRTENRNTSNGLVVSRD